MKKFHKIYMQIFPYESENFLGEKISFDNFMEQMKIN